MWPNCRVAVDEFYNNTGVNTNFNYPLELIKVHISYLSNLPVAVLYSMYTVDIDSSICLPTKSYATVQMRL